jgi:hypothetical protein
MIRRAMVEALVEHVETRIGESVSIADIFLEASRELARSDSRIYRSVDKHLARTRNILSHAEAALELPLLLETAEDFVLGEPSYERQTRKSLENLCRLKGIRGYSRMTKVGMISRLKAEGVPEPPIPLDSFSKIELISLLEEAVRRLKNR